MIHKYVFWFKESIGIFESSLTSFCPVSVFQDGDAGGPPYWDIIIPVAYNDNVGESSVFYSK